MSFVRLIYASRATAAFQPSSIQSILQAARRNNSQNGVTGVLCFNQLGFLQCLEGKRSDVNRTFERILRDPRHDHAEIICYRYTDQREFENWNMGYLQNNQVMRDLLMRNTGSTEFLPLTLIPEDAFAILKDVRNIIEDSM
ncbi:Blue light-and temperature-regulated antirepressor YcgF [Marinomonas aquimarina]|uniref:Blue light-and temperature-regulated antirepressor YcgF n=1 Tax=Marinomonas aquimarina TaxID=295068 RepID=A0A1A8TQB1_9GAMM|nr:BLUF domain-containing protein [Marinomonas aquimarina]SBS35609.1 Blue light-and temperature-regulated antirepressor YcgF [Marinomonas aquimarina]